MRRREFITLLGGAAAWPVAARAQQPGMPVIGYLHSGSPETGEDRVAMFRAGLGEMGFAEGRNVSIQFSWAFDQHDRLPVLAAELARRRVDVIFAGGGTPTAVAAKDATTTIPVVFQIAGDPAETDLVASLNRPGGNVTGVAAFSRELVAKRVELIRELMPDVVTVGFLNDPSSQVAENRRNDFEAAARTLKLRSFIVKASAEREIGDAFDILVREGVRAVVVQGAPRFGNFRKLIIALALRHRIAAIYEQPEIARAGGLASYGSSSVEATRRAGTYVGRILKGEKPSDLPILLPTKFELVINLKTAKTLGLTIPPTLLARADEVIE